MSRTLTTFDNPHVAHASEEERFIRVLVVAILVGGFLLGCGIVTAVFFSLFA